MYQNTNKIESILTELVNVNKATMSLLIIQIGVQSENLDKSDGQKVLAQIEETLEKFGQMV